MSVYLVLVEIHLVARRNRTLCFVPEYYCQKPEFRPSGEVLLATRRRLAKFYSYWILPGQTIVISNDNGRAVCQTSSSNSRLYLAPSATTLRSSLLPQNTTHLTNQVKCNQTRAVKTVVVRVFCFGGLGSMQLRNLPVHRLLTRHLLLSEFLVPVWIAL